ncbi:NAD(P)H-hydrate epimerase, partial [Tabrizicola sp.]|uniref:NAD(P)H-hydrate epimerase n=1 Tax=Tabrizicola sp. TaxID=2005166 RepID=UPI0035B2A609
MTKLLTAAQMRAIEQAAIASGEVTGLDLMERAGRGVVEAIFEEWPELRASPQRAIVVCGPGNNGGDGFVVARLLKDHGWGVWVKFDFDPEILPPTASEMRKRWLAVSQESSVASVTPTGEKISDVIYNCDGQYGDFVFVVDALFGVGLSRPFESDEFKGAYLDLRSLLDDEDIFHKVVSIDVPSGLCADSGRLLSRNGAQYFGAPLRADLTVACGFAKTGHYLAHGPAVCGKVVVAGLGWLGPMGFGSANYRNPVENGVALICKRNLIGIPGNYGTKSRHLGKANSHLLDHKYSHGHALILSGPSGRGGAARLAARGALRIGAGVVTVGCPLDAIAENAARLDAVMLRGVADGAALAGVLEDGRINALCLGPGMGVGEREAGLMAVALGRAALESRGGGRPHRAGVGGVRAAPPPGPPTPKA